MMVFGGYCKEQTNVQHGFGLSLSNKNFKNYTRAHSDTYRYIVHPS